MKKNYLLLIIFSLIFVAGNHKDLRAQNFGLGDTKLAIVGNAQVDFVSTKDQSQFRNLAFKPIFLWSLSDRLFIESELEVATDAGSVELVLEYANMVYFINQYIAIHAGRFLPKFGAYRGRFGEAFLNKLATDPVGFGDGGIGPMIETGIGLQGGTQLGLSKINYDFYVTNGPKLLTGSPDAPDEAGQFEYEAYDSNNKGKALGGRFGFLPFSNSSLEIGYSIEHKSRTGDLGTNYEKTPVTMQAIDLDYFTSIDFIKSTVRILGEWKSLYAGDIYYEDQFNPGVTYTFENKSTAYYALFSIRPSQSANGFIHDFELAARYSEFNTPMGAIWGGGIKKQTAIGLNYWYRWNGAMKFTYQKQDGQDSFVAQLVYGF